MIILSQDKKDSVEPAGSTAEDCASVAAASVATPPPAYTRVQSDARASSYLPEWEYEDAEEEEREAHTILKTLFWIGFLLPFLWIWGTFVFFVNLSRAPGVRVKLDAEGQQVVITKHEIRLLRRQHAMELKWARRHALALLGILVLLAVITISVFIKLL